MKKTSTLICPECDKGKLEAKTVALTGKTHGEAFTVTSEALVCPLCGFKTVPKEGMATFGLRISDAYRQAHSLFTSSEIKHLRRRLRMSQQEFADYLGVGVASVKRWELGSIQDKAMNDLMALTVKGRRAQA